MLDYRMETFVTVCRLLNFTKAAKALHITQPTVSLHIHSLEEFYQVKLFVFHGKKIEITTAGQLLLESSLTQMHDENQLRKKMLLKDQLPIRLGATQSVAEGMLRDPLSSFLKYHKQYFIKLEIGNTDTLLEKINTGELDAAFVEGYFSLTKFDYTCYAKEAFIAVCSAAYPNHQSFHKIEDVFSQPLILREEGSGTRHIFERYLHEHHHSIQDFANIIEIGSIHLIKEIVEKKCGITFIYERIVADELSTGVLYKIPLQDFHIYHNINFIWRKGSMYAKEYQELLDVFKSSSPSKER